MITLSVLQIASRSPLTKPRCERPTANPFQRVIQLCISQGAPGGSIYARWFIRQFSSMFQNEGSEWNVRYFGRWVRAGEYHSLILYILNTRYDLGVTKL